MERQMDKYSIRWSFSRRFVVIVGRSHRIVRCFLKIDGRSRIDCRYAVIIVVLSYRLSFVVIVDRSSVVVFLKSMVVLTESR